MVIKFSSKSLKVDYIDKLPKRGLKLVFDHKENHSLDSPVKLGFCLSKDIGQCTSLDLWRYKISLVFEKSLHKELVMMPRGSEVLKMIHQFHKVLTKTRVWGFINFS